MILLMDGINTNTKKIKYNNVDKKSVEFRKDLDARINNYFVVNNLSKKDTLLGWSRALLFLFLAYFIWYQLIFVSHHIATIVMMVLAQIVVFHTLAAVVAHDAVHGAISKYKWLNNLVYFVSFTTIGGNYYVWSVRHNIPHHFYVNIPGCDVDIEAAKILRLAPHCPWKPIHRFQHLYAPILYSIFTMHWIFIKDFKMFTMNEFGNVSKATYPWYRWLEMIVLKIFYVGMFIVTPIMYSPFTAVQVLTTFVLFHLVFSYFLTIAFSSSHVIKDSKFIMYDKEGNLPFSFYEHQLLTSFDFYPENKLVSFFYGGFNSHVAHHFYGNINSTHFPTLSKIIKQTCKEHKMPYNEAPLWWLAREHNRFLRHLGADSAHGKENFIGHEHYV